MVNQSATINLPAMGQTVMGCHRLWRPITALGLLSWGVLLAACGCGSSDRQVKVAQVTGIVTYNGVPVRDAFVKFTQEGCPIAAGGFTDDMGRFELTSYQSGDGAPVGENQVTVTAVSRASGNPDDLQSLQAEAAAIENPVERRAKLDELTTRQKSAQRGAAAAPPRSQIPKRYASVGTSKLTFTVGAGEENECVLELTD